MKRIHLQTLACDKLAGKVGNGRGIARNQRRFVFSDFLGSQPELGRKLSQRCEDFLRVLLASLDRILSVGTLKTVLTYI